MALGEYIYTFKSKAPAGFNPSLTNRIGIYGSRNLTEWGLGTDYADTTFDFVPAGGTPAPRDVVLECLRKLSDSQRQLLDDHYANRLSGREIAERTGRKADAVFQSLHRTRETLLRCIEQGLTKRGDN